MCLETLAYIAVAATIASAGYTAYSQYQIGKAQKASADATANNLRKAAFDDMERGVEAETMHRRELQQRAADAEARMAGAGIDISRGSAASLLDDFAEVEFLDARTIRENARREAQHKLDQAEIVRAEGANAAVAGQMGAAGSLLEGVAGASGKWYQMKAPAGAR